MAEARSRGYFGIGVEGVSKSANVGALLRTAHAFGAAFCFIVGAGFDARAGRLADTPDTPEHVPLWRFPDIASLQLPQRCVLVGVELLETATDLPSFRHPLNAAYVLGPERSGLSPAMMQRCQHVVRIPSRFALNLAVAGALVLYDRMLQHGRFAERPVGSRGATAAEPVQAGHGAPHFRRNIPDWVAQERAARAKKP
jgi:tRNA G18 (ribose-2'-O)-methylase SpoU